jgi:hypothetical protein
LNPGPLALKSDALPLSYGGIDEKLALRVRPYTKNATKYPVI